MTTTTANYSLSEQANLKRVHDNTPNLSETEIKISQALADLMDALREHEYYYGTTRAEGRFMLGAEMLQKEYYEQNEYQEIFHYP